MTTVTLTVDHAHRLAALAEERGLWSVLRRIMRYLIEGGV